MTATQNKLTVYDVMFRFHTEMTIAELMFQMSRLTAYELIDTQTVEIKNIHLTLHSMKLQTVPIINTPFEVRQLIRSIAGKYLENGVEVAAVISGEPALKEPEELILEGLEEEHEGDTPSKRYSALTEKAMMDALLLIFPEATVSEDNNGQLIVYTGMRFRTVIVPFELK